MEALKIKRHNPLKVDDIVYPFIRKERKFGKSFDCSPIRVWHQDNQREIWFTTAIIIGESTLSERYEIPENFKYFGWVDPSSSFPMGIKVFITNFNQQLLVIKGGCAFLHDNQAIMIDEVFRKSAKGHIVGFNATPRCECAEEM